MRKPLLIILSMLTTVFIGFGLIIPVLPLMITNAGAKPFNLGMMLAVYSGISFFIAPLWGRLSDRIGRRSVLIIGLIGFMISFALFGVSSHIIWLMYLSRVIGGVFSGAVTATAMAYVADVTDNENRTKGMALAGMSIGLGFVLGPAIGGILSVYGIEVPFFVAAGLALANAIWGYIALPESHKREVPSSTQSKDTKSAWTAFSGPLKYLYLVDFVSQFSISALEGSFQYFEIQKIHATAEEIGWMFFITGIVGALIQGGFVRRYVKQGREVPTILVGLALSAVGMFLITESSSFLNAALFMTVFGAGNTVIKPILTSVITKETTLGQGLANGLISSMDSLSRVLGPIASTLLFEVHASLPFIITAIVIIVGIPLVIQYSRQHNAAQVSKTLNNP